MNQTALSALIWSVADLLRGDYKQSEYGRVILPFTVLRRLDCVLAASKPAVLAEKAKREAAGLDPDPFLRRVSAVKFYNTSPLDLPTLMGDPDHIASNLGSYVQGFAPEVREIFERFDFAAQVHRLAKADLLYLVTEKFAHVDLHPDRVDNVQMGLVFEELIRKFAELSNETAGEHFTPREVIRLMVHLLFIEDDEVLTPGNNVVRTLYDPTAGTGGMLSVAAEFLRDHNPDARLSLFDQELNDESYAICKADMLIRGQDVTNVVPGNTLSDDGHAARKFDYMLSNPPFGVEWKKVEKAIRKEHEEKGYDGRFGPGLPRVSDGSMLFLLHLVSKMRPRVDGGSRSGVRAICSDCHVPHEWTPKLVRKVQASKELWGKLTGYVDTPEKFEAHRMELATHEWERMKAVDSRECRNCHSFEAMSADKQRQSVYNKHMKAKADGQTCIDCHKGIAHHLPKEYRDPDEE